MTSLAVRPLEGVRVLNLTVALAGPYAALLRGGPNVEIDALRASGVI